MLEIFVRYPELKVVLFFLGLFNIYITVLMLFYKGCKASQKLGKLLIIWLVPVIGGVFIRAVIKESLGKSRYSSSYTAAHFDDDGGHHD